MIHFSLSITNGVLILPVIDNEKCIGCGACVYQCPFGAVMDKSYILDAINILRGSENNKRYKVYAVVAPSISGQFDDSIGKVVAALKKLGFFSVVEAALGADMVAYKEAQELMEKGFLTSSCCPAFVRYIETQFPDMVKHISHNLSPMAEIAKYIKQTCEDVCSGKLDLDRLMKLNYADSMEALLSCYGIGVKVANCICLFGLHHIGAFPVDTWIKKILLREYAPKSHCTGHVPETRLCEALIAENFSKYPGFAGVLQQYIFFYEREFSQKILQDTNGIKYNR